MRTTAALLGALFLLEGCGAREGNDTHASSERTPAVSAPVRTAPVSRATLLETVSGSGRTAALTQQKVRSPFPGTLTELHVVDGDAVHSGQPVGTVVSRESEAALSGAREMEREARTESEKRDAERARELAEKNLVSRTLRASADGIVLSHSATSGDRVSEDQEILTIEDAASVVFLADIAQTQLPLIRPGQSATIELAGRSAPTQGVVHAILPGANAADFTGPVRIDLPRGSGTLPLGLFGTAHVIVGEHRNVPVVPDAAILRDDVSGVSRVATVAQGHTHWVTVTTGLREGGRTEITSQGLSVGDPVIVSGMVGLPEGKPVSVEP